MAKFEDLKGMKLPGVQKDGHFFSKHPEKIFQNGKSVANPAWVKDQAVFRSQAKDLARINQQDIMRGAAQHEQNMRNPEKQKPFRMPKGTKLPGILGYPGMFMQFMDYYNQQQAPTTSIDGVPLQTQLDTLRNLKVS
jgi:hypothetical protein